MSATDPAPPLNDEDRALLARYVEAFERYDIEALTSLIQEDATQSMPPFDLWLRGRDDIFTWWFGPGIGCKGSRVIPTCRRTARRRSASTSRAPDGGYEPWALQVLELEDGRIVEFTFFLDTATLFPLFGLPLQPRRVAPRRRPANASSSCSSLEAWRSRSSRPSRRALSWSRARASIAAASGTTAPTSQTIVLRQVPVI